jgi:polar amino acid transport system permease protein
VAAIVALAAYVIIPNPNIQWSVVGQYLFEGTILQGLLDTLILAIIATILSIFFGVVFGLFRLSQNPILRGVGAAYVWIFRSVPTLIQILFWGNLALFVPALTVGVPGTSATLFSVPTNHIVTPLVASVMALSVANGSYFAEIVRSGFLSVGEGQRRAAAGLGLTWWQTQRTVVLPIAMRVMLPPAGSQFITILKETTLVSVIGGGDILSKAETIYGNNFKVVELLMVAAIWFLVVTSVTYVGQSLLERRFGRGQYGSSRRTRAVRGTPGAAATEGEIS